MLKPVACNVMWGKREEKKTTRTKSGYRKVGQKPSWKKAIVTLSPGEKIDLFEGV